jgi:PKD repeat protein
MPENIFRLDILRKIKLKSERCLEIANILLLAFLILSCISIFNPSIIDSFVVPVVASTGTPTVWIKIHRIQAVDPIEIGWIGEWPEDGPDFLCVISIWNGEEFIEKTYKVEPDKYDVILDEINSFKIKTVATTIYIILYEMDGERQDQVADISSDPSIVKGNQAPPPPRGAIYEGLYNLKTNSLTGDKTYLEEGYYKTSGDYDGSVGVDENDANLWFTIWDDYEPPKANAGMDQTVYTGDKVNFDGSTSAASPGSSVVKYGWDFDSDGVIDVEGQKTSYTYTKSGQYIVTLRVTDDLGEMDTDTCILTVLNRPPTASFTFSPSDPSIQDTIHFIDRSTDIDGTVVSWYWEFGDGATSTENNPTHTYADKGVYTVRLTVTDNEGVKGMISMSIRIRNLSPTADFVYTPTELKAGDDIQFTDKSTDPEGKISTWLWDFGDGYTSTQRNSTHKYEKAGTYTVQLTVTDDEGATHSASKTITLKEAQLIPIPSTFQEQPWLFMILGLIMLAVIGIIILRRKRTASEVTTNKKMKQTSSLEEMKPGLESSTKVKLELERERIMEMLKTFKEKYDKGEIDEKTYLRMKTKYENELKKLG